MVASMVAIIISLSPATAFYTKAPGLQILQISIGFVPALVIIFEGDLYQC